MKRASFRFATVRRSFNAVQQISSAITASTSDHCGSRQIGRFTFTSAGHSPITRSLSAPTTTSCSSAEKSSFPEVDLTSNILPRALNPLDPKPNTHTHTRRGDMKEQRLELRSEWIQSEYEHLKCRKKDIHGGVADVKERLFHLYIGTKHINPL